MKRCSARSETAWINVNGAVTYSISELIDECQNLDCLWMKATVTTRQFRSSKHAPDVGCRSCLTGGTFPACKLMGRLMML
jgi:hypothetical protein